MSVNTRSKLIRVRGRCTRVHRKINEVVRDIESRRARITNMVKVLLACREGTGINRTTARKENKPVKESDDVGARLMDGENNGAVVCLGQCDEAFNHIERVVCILEMG